MNPHNEKLAAQGRKRRAKYLRLNTMGKKPLTATELAKRFGVSHQRMSYMLRRAVVEAALSGEGVRRVLEKMKGK